MFSQVNLFLLAVITMPLSIAKVGVDNIYLVTVVSVALEIGLFAIIITVHCITAVQRWRNYRKWQENEFSPLVPKLCKPQVASLKLYGTMRASCKTLTSEPTTSIVTRQREDLIYDD